MKTNYIIFSVCISIILLGVLYYTVDKPIQEIEQANIEKGYMEISLKDEIKFELNGEWEVVYDELLTPDEFVESSNTYIYVPSLWDYDGVATYKLTIHSDADIRSLGIRAPIVYSAYQLYYNDRLIAYNGYPSEDKALEKIERKNFIQDIHLRPGDNTFILQVSNHRLFKGGVSRSIILMDYEELYVYNNNMKIIDTVFAGGYLFIFIFFVIIYLVLPDMLLLLYFALVSFGLFLKTLVTNSILLSEIVNGFSWGIGNRIESGFYMVIVPMILLIIIMIFSDVFESNLLNVLRGVILANLLIVALLPHKIYDTIMIGELAVLFFLIGYILYTIIINIKYYYHDVVLFLIAVMVVLAYAIYDVITFILMTSYTYKLHFSMFILSIFLVVLMMIRFENAIKYKGL